MKRIFVCAMLILIAEAVFTEENAGETAESVQAQAEQKVKEQAAAYSKRIFFKLDGFARHDAEFHARN